jgi:hypothetical protein
MRSSYTRPKEPDPIIWKDGSSPNAGLSVASTTITFYYPFKASYGDLAGLVEPEPLMLPLGSLDRHLESECSDSASDHGSRHGKYVSRSISREVSIDGESSDVEPETIELFTRLLLDADRITKNTGCHVKKTKLTTSKTSPQKTFLRHADD